MPTFDTPRPISVRLNLGFVVANIQITAEDDATTTVDVQPVDASRRADVRTAEQTRVEYADDRLTVRAPRLSSLLGRPGSVDVVITLPSGSELQGETGMGEFVSLGRLGDCRFKTGYGDVRIDEVGAARVTSASGSVTVEHAAGVVEISASNGAVNIGRVDGPATVKCSNGATWIGEAVGELRVTGVNGVIDVDRARADVTAKNANGSVRVGEVTRGAVTMETAAGSLDLGVRTGVAVWLDVKTISGRVRNELAATPGPDDPDETVEVRARTHVGDIVIRRADAEARDRTHSEEL